MEAIMDGLADRRVGELVAEDYSRAAVFQRFGIDFCCGGGRTLRTACERAGVEYEEVSREMTEAMNRATATDPSADARSWPLVELIEHIVTEHHAYVRNTIPVLQQFTSKVAHVHGERHNELHEIRVLVEALGRELERHMEEEETGLFPQIANLASRTGAVELPAVLVPLEDDHDRAGALMARIRELSQGFAPPADACTTYRAAFVKLREFEADLHRHVHLENNILFPRARSAAETGSS
jgi:regulator of cell morphogenesis and NO signaling